MSFNSKLCGKSELRTTVSPVTVAETLFEAFCDAHGITWEKVPTGKTRTPDYLIDWNGQAVCFELKQIDEDKEFQMSQGSRTVGDHVRQKIADSRKQIQVGAKMGIPSVLLIYNNLDPFHMFGTEQHDFIAAMYGEYTVVLKDSRIVDSYQGRNSSLRENHNSSFSAVGHLQHSPAGTTVRLYENAFARNPLPAALLPRCFEYIHFEVNYRAAQPCSRADLREKP